MAKKKTAKKSTSGEQLDLIDVQPKNKKELLRSARRYKTVQRARIDALNAELAEKEKLLAAVRAAKIVPDPDGSYRFRVDDCTIKVTPRDELVQVKFANDEE